VAEGMERFVSIEVTLCRYPAGGRGVGHEQRRVRGRATSDGI
jgi:hypothetical protein